MIESFEPLLLMSATMIEGTDVGGDHNDNDIFAGGDDDAIHAPLGNNTIDGGAGDDSIVIYDCVRANYGIRDLADVSVIPEGPGLNVSEVRNPLFNVERILFNDGELLLDNDPEAASPTTPVAEQPIEQPIESNGSAEQPPESPDRADQPAERTTTNDLPVSTDPPLSADIVGFGANENEFITQVVTLTNQVRSEYGIAPLTVNLELQVAAQAHVENMAFQDFFSHTGPDGLQPWDRAENAGYDYQTIGENIAAGQRTPAEVVQAWVDSPGHLANILNGQFTEIGVGYEYLQNDTGVVNYNHYWGQAFGTERYSV